MQFQTQRCYGPNHCRHSRAARHITFHSIHKVGRLEAHPAGIVNHAFSNKDNRFGIEGAFGFPLHNSECGRVDTAAVNGQQSTHFQCLYFAFVHYFHYCTCGLKFFGKPGCKSLSIKVVQRFVNQVARPANGRSCGCKSAEFAFADKV